jgi:hypothetical protein
MQGFFARSSNRSLSLAMVGEESQLALVSANVSAARAAVLSEDVASARRLYQEGGLEPRELLEARRELEIAARRLLEEEKGRQSIDSRGRRAAGGHDGRREDDSGIPAVRR